ncbi:hypothetical protein [uncultured Porphyromonas sp.]|uniref:hypothetical protein n=1 Tax=uncultured Porphyromonas sp. TaxID=159274 RepID=UPI00260C05C0|nr:hypothetical protein [uncultured Porphyromonas sp.]
MQEHNYTDVESSTSQNGDANHQKIQADFEAVGADRKNILVPQKRGITKKMGKKCFCGTTLIFVIQKTAPKNLLPSREFSSKVASKNNPKNEQKQELNFPRPTDAYLGDFSIFAVDTNK